VGELQGVIPEHGVIKKEVVEHGNGERRERKRREKREGGEGQSLLALGLPSL
jgi:hypothetical protein